MEKDSDYSDQEIDFVDTKPSERMFTRVETESYTSTEYLRLILLFVLWIGLLVLIYSVFFKG